MKRFLRATQIALAVLGSAMLSWCGYVLIDTWRFQSGERFQLDSLAADRPAVAPPSTPVAAGGLIGSISIERLGLSAIVMEGTTRATLRRAVGHIAGTGLPGSAGNIGISGHRDTFFRPLRNVRPDDTITLTTPLGEYRYRVVSTKVVAPSDVAVLDPDALEILTLVTCYPFYLVGPAPRRFIVRAERIDSLSRNEPVSDPMHR